MLPGLFLYEKLYLPITYLKKFFTQEKSLISPSDARPLLRRVELRLSSRHRRRHINVFVRSAAHPYATVGFSDEGQEAEGDCGVGEFLFVWIKTIVEGGERGRKCGALSVLTEGE